jgi:hypothetical protein
MLDGMEVGMGSVTLDPGVKFYLAEVDNTHRSRLTLDLCERALLYSCSFRNPEERITPRFGDRHVGSFTRHDITTFLGGLTDVRKESSRDTRQDRIDKPVSLLSLHVYARALRSF